MVVQNEMVKLMKDELVIKTDKEIRPYKWELSKLNEGLAQCLGCNVTSVNFESNYLGS